jgi:Tfp pilus assembly protein PilF
MSNSMLPLRRRGPLLAVAATLALAACAGDPPPTDTLARADLAVSRAEQSPAQVSAGDLKLARDKLEQAKVAMAKEDYVTARRLSAEAEVDAQLAEAKAQDQSTQATLGQIKTDANGVQQGATTKLAPATTTLPAATTQGVMP